MDSGQVFYIVSRLALGAVASFLAIRLWSKTRDAAWMLMFLGIITSYAETVHSILKLFGITLLNTVSVGSMSLVSIILPCLPMVFFIAAFAVMVARKYRH
jgi:hypothetical protein